MLPWSSLARDVDYLAPWVARLGDESGSMPIHVPERGPRLMLVHRREGQMGAIHDHATWVAAVSHDRRPRDAPTVSFHGEQGWPHGPRGRRGICETCSRATFVDAPPPLEDLHDHGHLAGRGVPAYVLIMTGDDQRLFRRNEWDLATGRHRILEPGDGLAAGSNRVPTDAGRLTFPKSHPKTVNVPEPPVR